MNWLKTIHYNLQRNTEKVDSNVIESDTTFYTSYMDYYLSEEEPVFSPTICLYLMLRELSRIQKGNCPEIFETMCDMLTLKRSNYVHVYPNIPRKRLCIKGTKTDWEYVMRTTQTLKQEHMSTLMETYRWKWFMDSCYVSIQKILNKEDISILPFYFYNDEFKSDVWYGIWSDEYDKQYIKIMGFVSGGQLGEITYEVFNKHVYDCL